MTLRFILPGDDAKLEVKAEIAAAIAGEEEFGHGAQVRRRSATASPRRIQQFIARTVRLSAPHRLEDLLVEEGLIDEARLRHVRRYARHEGVCLARAAVEIGGISDELLASTLARRAARCRASIFCARASTTMRCARCRTIWPKCGGCLPLSIDRSGTRRVIRVAMADPLDFDAIEEIEMSTGCTVEPLIGRGRRDWRRHRRAITAA